MDLRERRVLVVGANGVLGAGIARALRASGAQVIGTARDAEGAARLDATLDERLLVDLTDDGSISTLATYLASAGRGLDGIVNAAGLVGFGPATTTTASDAALLMRVNHLGPADLITRLLPTLTASATAGHQPFVCGITGIVAERAFPGMAAYVASKSAHAAWLAALRLDVRRAGIRVLNTHPGHTETGLATRAAFGTAPRFAAGMTPEHVVTRIVAAIREDATELASTDFA